MPWTEDDIKTAENFLAEKDKYDANLGFVGCMHRVARSFGFSGYGDPLLVGVRSYISSLPKNRNELVVNKKQTPENIWMEDVLSNPDMQHFLHPEDDAELISAIEKSE